MPGQKPGKSWVAEADWLNLNYRCAAIITGVVYMQSQVLCDFFINSRREKESSSPVDRANQQSVKCILSAEGDFNTRLVVSH